MPRARILSWVVTISALLSSASVYADADAAGDTAGSRDRRLLQAHNSFDGPTGGLRVIDASSGPPATFRLALSTEFFVARNVFVPDDRAQHFAGNLSFSASATRFLEVFASAEVTSAWDDSTNPMLVQRVADVLVGLKAYHWIRPWVAFGGDVSFEVPGGVGDVGQSFRSSSVGLRLNNNLDFRNRGVREAPFILRINAQYWFDNSGKLTDSLARPGPLTPFDRFAYGINQTDSVRLGVGFEVPLSTRKVGLHPLVDWRWDLPVNRQGFECAPSTIPGGDSCLDEVGASAYPMTVTLGFRIYTPPRGLSFTVAADVGITGTNDFVQELAPTAPYNVILGIAYAIDPRPSRLPQQGSSAVTPTPRGRVYGFVIDSNQERPIEGAQILIVGDEASAQVTDQDGRFITAPLPVGSASLEVRHPDYLPATCEASFDLTQTGPNFEPVGEATCLMSAASADGQLRIQVVGGQGAPVPGVVVAVRGPTEVRAQSDANGLVEVRLAEGSYQVHVEDARYLLAVREAEVITRQQTDITIQAFLPPTRPRVLVREREIILRSQISFATGSDEILSRSEPLLLEIADALLRDPSLLLVEVQGHTDNRGTMETNAELSQNRAAAVGQWLVEHGVESGRLTARGYGSTRPIAPNITAYNRARNRRVQFKIVRRADDAAPRAQ